MPVHQSAQVANFEFGAPTTTGTVLDFSATSGGEVDLTFTNDGDATATISVEVSADGSSYSATTSGANQTAVTNVTIAPRVTSTFTILLRAGTDGFFRVRASGGTRMTAQLRRHEILGVQERRF